MLEAHQFGMPDTPSHHTLELTFDQREKSRLRAFTTTGIEVGISLKPGTILKHGDLLSLSDGTCVKIVAAMEPVMEVCAESATRFAVIAYHIGNRHVPLEIGESVMWLLPDHVLRAMVEGLGGQVRFVDAPFTPEPGAYGHSHVHHSHDDQGHGGRIHAGLSARPLQVADPR